MFYAMSDLHGEHNKYAAMLEKIQFSDDDTLFVLGDVVDRGPEPVKILQDMAARDNIYFLKGNHEAMASYVLRRLNVTITEDNAETHLDATLMQAILEWQQNGGDVTMKAFQALSCEAREDLLDYIDDSPLYDTVDVGERTFVLVHAGLGNFDRRKRLREYTPDELLCSRPDYTRRYYDDPSIYIVTGHIPTLAVTGRAEIYHLHNNILIDCGAGKGGKLACLCLDTLEAYYT